MGFHGVDLSSLPTTPMPKMTLLSITLTRDVISKEEVVGIMERFPSLKKLILSPCIDLQSAFVVPKYSPSLHDLRINVYNEERKAELTYTDNGQPYGRPGITDLCMGNYAWHHFNQHEIAALLKDYSSTLNRMNWYMPLDNYNDNKITGIEYPCLTKLVIESAGWWLPPNAPMLEDLTITSRAICSNHTVLDTVPPKLKKLTLLLSRGSSPDNMAPIIRYLGRFSHHSHLKELVVRFDSMEQMHQGLPIISRLNQLERLTILDYIWDYPTTILEELVNGCPQLTYLDIGLGRPPTTHAINILKRLKYLQHFTVSINGIMDHGDFLAALHTFSQLKCIRIRPQHRLNKVNKDAIGRLMMHRPDLEVIVVDRMLQEFTNLL